ncbi:MAG: type I-MYXAN CRISPR-associated Cas8a1/Cmx1 [Desulfobacteraceae bacterium]|nr:type I-MYXAN CRISPR-associated Cas8a1/Cmx1 [Desulfobacteraceae bacterium]
MADVLTPKIEWSLFDDGMGILERAGLAGLYLSLSAADEWSEKGDEFVNNLKKVLQWKLEDARVALFWDNDEMEALTKLIEWTWQIRDSVYYMPGTHRGEDTREHAYLRVHTHSGLLGTFLQFGGQLRPKVKEPELLLVQFGEDPAECVALKYRAIYEGETIRQLNLLHKKICPLKTRKGDYRTITLPGWAHPGAAKRFGQKDQDWTGTTREALLLMFSPISCFYLRLPNEKAKKIMRENWAFVVPEINSLELIARKYPVIQRELQGRFDRVQVSGLGDAGLRFAAAYSGRHAERQIDSPTIYVTAMGVTDYYSSSPMITTRIRKRIFELKPSSGSIARYNKIMKILPNLYVKRKNDENGEGSKDKGFAGTHWLKQPSPRGRIAENILNNRPWYFDLRNPLKWQIDLLEKTRKERDDNISIERLWFENLRFEWRNLMKLVNEEKMWDTEEEMAFVKIMEGSLRRLLDKEEKGLKRGGTRSLHDRWDDRVEGVRRSLMHAKTLTLTRKIFSELFAEAGGSKDLTQGKEMVWKILNHPYDWQKARDLGLLALVTFTDGRLA